MSIINKAERDSLSNYLSNESEELLEWNTFKKQLSTFALTSVGRKSILNLEIPNDLDSTKELLKETIEINALEKEDNNKIDFKGVFDIQDNIKLCAKGGILNPVQLLEIADTIASSIRLKKIISNNESRPILSSIISSDLVNTF